MKYLFLPLFLIMLSSCAWHFGNIKRQPYVPQSEPKEVFDALCAEGDSGFKVYLDLFLTYVSHDYYIMLKDGDSVNLKKKQCYMEQVSHEPFYFFQNTELYFAQCKFNNKVSFREINLIIKFQDVNYKKVQRVLDGKTWLLSNDQCVFLKQKKLIPYESLIKKQ